MQDAAIAILAALPLGMAFASRSAQAFLVLAAAASLAGRLAQGEGALLRTKLLVLLSRPLARACLAFVAFALVSIAWGHRPGRSLDVFGEFALSAGAGLSLALTLPRRLRPVHLSLAAAGLAAAAVVIVADIATGLAFRQLIGARAFAFIHNRPAVTLVLVALPVGALLWAERRRAAAILTALSGLAVLAVTESMTARLALLAGVAGFGLAMLPRRVAMIGAAGGILGLLAVAPMLGPLAERAIPPQLLATMQSAHARERIEIWRGFGAVAAEHPFLGTGFGTSATMRTHPVVDRVPAELHKALAEPHAHNGYLQIWTELGLVGALIAATALLLLLRGWSRLPPERARPAMALLCAGAAVFLVSHGAWQGWWIAVLATGCLWLGRGLERGGAR
jgi:hypothetical protein